MTPRKALEDLYAAAAPFTKRRGPKSDALSKAVMAVTALLDPTTFERCMRTICAPEGNVTPIAWAVLNRKAKR